MGTPKAQLRLDWIYGYRGHQCRNNIYYTHQGDIVYFVAASVIIYNSSKKSQRHFAEHKDDVISMCQHSNQRYIASGEIGSKPIIYVWDVEDLNILSLIVGQHSSGIAALAFSSSGDMLGSVDLAENSTFCIYDWRKGRLLASHSQQSERVFDIRFKPGDDSNIVTCGVKHINFWKHCGNALDITQGKLGKSGEIQSQMCLVFGPDDVCYSGTLSGDIYQWRNGQLLSITSHAHEGAIFSMNRSEEGIASVGKDAVVKLWSNNLTLITTIPLTNTNLGPDQLCLRSVIWMEDKILVGTKTSAIIEIDVKDRSRPKILVCGHSEGEMWALDTHPKKDHFVTGSDDNTIRAWDATKHSLLSVSTMSDAVRALAFSPNGQELSVGLKNGDLLLVEYPSMKKIAELIGNGEAIHELKFSPNGEYLAAGYNDGLILAFNTSKGFSKPIIFRGHHEFITHLDWSKDGQYLLSNAGVSEAKIFSIAEGQEVQEADTKPATITRVQGATVQGIFPKFMKDVNDVNSIDVDLNTGLLVSGDDYGNVKLFSYPSDEAGAKYRRYIGHSAHVTNVRYNHDKTLVLSVGGADHAVFQWKVYRDMDVPGEHSQTVDSCDEETDTSDAELDSDIEQETQITYDRKRDDAKERKAKSKAVKVNRPPAPDGGLNLDFVFGYRGYDARNNIHFTAHKEIVYHVAALGVLYNSETHTQRFYTKHTDDILCLRLHPLKDYVATGQIGKDPAIHVWDTQTTSTISILKGQHQRGVCSLDFSSDGKMLASVGLDDNHTIVIWGWRKGEKLASVRGNKARVFAVSWRTSFNDSLVSVGVKHIQFWSMKGGSLTSKRGIFGKVGKQASMLSCAFSKSGDFCYSGADNGMIYKWQSNTLVSVTKAHKGGIYTIIALDKGFVSGGKDGFICLWDDKFENCLKQYSLTNFSTKNNHYDVPANQSIRGIALGQGKIVVGTRNGNIFEVSKMGEVELLVPGHCEGEVWGLAAHPKEQLIVTVSDDKQLKLWDALERSIRANKILPLEARSVCFSNCGKLLVVGFKDGSVQVLSSKDYSIIKQLKHRKENISCVAFSPNEDKYLAVGSHDNFVDVYNTSDFKRVCVCKGASSYITHIDWNTTGNLLMLNSGASELLFFEVPRGNRIPLRTSDIGSQSWFTWSGVLSPLCEGIWPAGSDVTDINGAHLSHNSKILATADDFGYVKLFEFPAFQKNAKCKKYVGHSAHVTNVRWTRDDSFLVTTGGGDTAVMLWSHRGFTQPSNNSESDSESDESGDEAYDSDVEFECSLDYNDKTYSNPIRIIGEGVRPDQKEIVFNSDTKISRKQTKSCDVTRKRNCCEVNDLRLRQVYGYRGYDARHNLHYLDSENQIVYHAAGLGIVMDIETNEQQFYSEHTDDIICLSVNKHPKFKNIVASGQIGSKAQILVWSTETLKTVSILQGFHEKGVCAVNFSSSGKLLVSVGLDEFHSMAVWQWAEGTKLASIQNTYLRVLYCEFRPDSDTKLVSVGQRHVHFWNLAGTALVSKKGSIPNELGVKMQTMLSIAFSTGGITYTGGISGDVFVWQDSALVRIIAKCHSGPVLALFTTLKDGLIVSGGKERNGKCVVKLWDQSMKRSKTFPVDAASPKSNVKALSRSKGYILTGTSKGDILVINERSGHVTTVQRNHGNGEVWGVATHPSQNMAATVSSDKTVRLWNFDDKRMESVGYLKSCGLTTDFHPNGSHLAVGCTDGTVVILSPNLQQIQLIRDNNKQIQAVKFSPSGKFLAVGGEDRSLSLYTVTPVTSTYTRLNTTRSLAGSVLQIDWTEDNTMVAVSLSSYEMAYVSCPEGKTVPGSNNLVYHTATSVNTDNMTGVWPKDSNRFDVNAADVAHGSSVVATGDDFGTVKLFEYPCRGRYAKHKNYYGHSAHVTGVRFTHDDQFLVSIGGEDSCVFVWESQM